MVNLGMNTEIEADSESEAVEKAKSVPIIEQNVFHTRAQQVFAIDPETQLPIEEE